MAKEPRLSGSHRSRRSRGPGGFRPSTGSILFLSNGHGEDLIAARIAAALRALIPSARLQTYPLVGYGDVYRREGFDVVGIQQAMPTGGFILKGAGNLWKDLQAGLLGLTRRQIADIKARRDGLQGVVAVGDVYPLFLAGRFLQLPLVFVATAKSEYIRGHFGWEYALMRRYARLVYARDPLTAEAMRRRGVNAEFVGNVMMDALPQTGADFGLEPGTRVVGLLPGSRQDAYDNAVDLLRVVEALGEKASAPADSPQADRPSTEHGRASKVRFSFLLSVAPSLELKTLAEAAAPHGWQASGAACRAGVEAILRKENPAEKGLEVALVTDAFADLLRRADIVVGLAGTANEQAAGLGKPVVTFPGRGMQFTPKFARDQKRLLGDAVSLVSRDPQVVAAEVLKILADPALYARMSHVGKERMGEPGGALKMARGIAVAFGLPIPRANP